MPIQAGKEVFWCSGVWLSSVYQAVGQAAVTSSDFSWLRAALGLQTAFSASCDRRASMLLDAEDADPAEGLGR